MSGKEFRVVKELGRVATCGRIWADGGPMFFQVSEVDGGARSQLKVTLLSGENYEFRKADAWLLGDVLITTDTLSAI
jgi:hypothetical protein